MARRFDKSSRENNNSTKKRLKGDITMSNKVMVKNEGFMTEDINLGEMIAEEMDGLTPTFERIKIPAGGGLAFEVPGEEPDSPDSVKEFKAVIIYHHPMNAYYKEKYAGGNTPPDCSSLDGKVGTKPDTGEICDCKTCPYAQFGSGENNGKACKQKRRIFLLREGEMLPLILSLPTGSLQEFSRYVMRLLQKGVKTNQVVTKFTLKKAQNSGGISYSQAIFSMDRMLSSEEQVKISKMSEQVKVFASSVVESEE